jgi:hypothetical protein
VAALMALLIRGGGDLPRRFLNLGLLILAGVLVAASWYWRNIDPVVDYLTNYGYGSQAANYGAEQSLLSWDRLNKVAARIGNDDLLAPMAVLLFAGLVALAVLVARRIRASEDRRAELIRLGSSDACALLLVVVAGYATLTSSRNGGNGFTFPLAMLLPPLAVVALRHYRRALVPAAMLVGLIATANVLAHTDASADLSRPRSVLVPGLGQVLWVNGVPRAVADIRRQSPGPPQRFVDADKRWLGVDHQLAQLAVEPIAPSNLPPVLTFGTRSHILSSNTVVLAGVLNDRTAIPVTQLLPEPADSVAAYEEQLRRTEFGFPIALLTASSSAGDYEPTLTQARVEAAARRLGFERIREIELPEGRQLRVWLKLPPA